MSDQSGRAKTARGLRVLVLSPTPTHPQDFGNRKRIFRICKRFVDDGAHVTFVHYPTELAWRGRVPADAERAMHQCWDHYYTVGPTHPPHPDPKGTVHTIDEWWDNAIGEFLRWIFSVQKIDIFIVNYAWLSKAFEYAPRGTLKILDTHDKVSGRLDMLASLRLNPEFFYTDEAQEAIALGRADLVWAIKDQERAAFEEMSPTPILTMPHVDPPQQSLRPAPDESGFLRVGIIGARNNVNRMNITEFLNAALPLFEEAFAPIKIVVAGTVCDLLEGIDSPFVDLRGPVDEVSEFYSSVDCVAVPMRASTGLKIKAGEALSLGVPLLSVAHAFEGYEPADPRHGLADFTALAQALIDLSFAPRSALDQLARASRISYSRTEARIGDALQETLECYSDTARSIVLAVDSRAFVPGSIFNLVLKSVYDYLRGLGIVRIAVVRGAAEDLAKNHRLAEHFNRVVVADDVEGAADLRGTLAAVGVQVENLDDFFTRLRPKVLVVDALHPVLEKIALPETVVFSRTDMIALSQERAPAWVPGKGFKRAFVVAPSSSRENAALAASVGGTTISQLCLRYAKLSGIRSAPVDGGRKTLAILGQRGSPAVNMAVAMARAWDLEPFVIHGFDDGKMDTSALDRPASFRTDIYLDSLLSLRVARPHFVIDLSLRHAGLGLCREILERLRVPLVSGSEVGVHPSMAKGAPIFRVGTERELWNAIRSFVQDSDDWRHSLFLRGWNELEAGNGWAWMQRFCGELFDAGQKIAA